MRNFSTVGGLRRSVRNLTLARGATAAFAGGMTTGAAQAQQPAFSAYPMPGTLTASPGTDISFRGGDAAALGAITVTGSKSGTHTGTLKLHSDGQGVTFAPAKPF